MESGFLDTPNWEEYEMLHAMDVLGSRIRAEKGMWTHPEHTPIPRETNQRLMVMDGEDIDSYFQEYCSWMDGNRRAWNPPMIVRRGARRNG